MSELDNFINKLKSHPYTTILGAIAGICAALATVDQLKDYASILQVVAGIATIFMGYFASDKVN